MTRVPGIGSVDVPTRVALLALQKQIDGMSAADVADIKATAATVAPSGWLDCDGAAHSRSTYAALFAAISTTFGVGDGVSTFNVPDLRGRTIIGVGTGSGLTARALNAAVGVEAVTLTGAESGTSVHNHTQNAHNHTQNAHNHATGGTGEMLHREGTFTSGYYGPAGATGLGINWQTPSSTTATNVAETATNIATTAANAAAAHNNMQPSRALRYVIKA